MTRRAGWRTPFLDFVLLLALGELLIIAVLLMFLHDPNQESAEDMRAAGELRFWCEWASELDADIDMWVRAPRGTPVGYSNKSNAYVDLLRDDLGWYRDPSRSNEEVQISRTLEPGEWILNVHYFNWHGGRTSSGWTDHQRERQAQPMQPVPVNCWAEIGQRGKEPSLITRREVTLHNTNDEQTAFRFTLDEDGSVVEGSINSRQTPLRSVQRPYG